MDARVKPAHDRDWVCRTGSYRRCGFFAAGRFGAGFFAGSGRGSAGNSPMASSMSASSARTRAALVPRSLTPMREAERTSMREPPSCSAHAHHHVVAEAHDECARHRLDDAVAARRRGRARIDDEPFAFVDHRERGAKGDGGRDSLVERRDVGIGRALQRRGLGARIVIAPARAQAGEQIELRRIDGIGGDVGDRRQLTAAIGEIAGIGEQQQAEEEPQHGAAEPAAP